MTDYYLANTVFAPGTGTHRTGWIASTAFALGDVCFGGTAFTFECTTAGTSGASQPDFVTPNTPGTTVTDGTVVWTCRAPTSWAWAHAYPAMLMGLVTGVDDRVFTAQDIYNHGSGTVTFAFTATTTGGAAQGLYGVNATAEPPNAYSANQRIFWMTSTSTLNLTGMVEIENMWFQIGSNTNAGIINVGGSIEARQVYRDCTFEIGGTSASGAIVVGATNLGNGQQIYWDDVKLQFAATTQGIVLYSELEWRGGGWVDSASVFPGSLFEVVGGSTQIARLRLEGLDLSAAPSTMYLMNAPAGTTLRFEATICNCLFPAGWRPTSRLVNGALDTGFKIALYDCTAGTEHWRSFIEGYRGTVRCGPQDAFSHAAEDSAGRYCWRLDADISANWVSPVATDPVVLWVPRYEQPVTFAMEVCSYSPLDDSHVWLEVTHALAEGLQRRTVSSRAATPLTTPVALTASTAAWTAPARENSTAYTTHDVFSISGVPFVCTAMGTTAASPPAEYGTVAEGDTVVDGDAVFLRLRRYKLSVQGWPLQDGYAEVRVVAGGSSLNLYVDPYVTVTP